MPYAVRNSIILAVLLLLVGGAGAGYIFFYQEPRIEELQAERAQIQQQLGDADDLFDRLVSVQERVEVLNASWKQRPKTLPVREEAANTNMYINDILTVSPELDLNVFTQEDVAQNGCGYVRYHLAGQGPFESFALLVQYLEFGPRLMKLANFDVREVHSVDDDLGRIRHTVQFDIDLLAYYSEQKPFADTLEARSLATVRIPTIGYNPFRSLVVPDIPPNTFDLPNVEQSSLLAIMKGRAFISDQGNQLVMLSEGDEVYLGYVSKIMPERRQVLFMLNKGGIIERYMLTLQLENQSFGKKRN
jgi:Tfp pilus assembly protein PilO